MTLTNQTATQILPYPEPISSATVNPVETYESEGTKTVMILGYIKIYIYIYIYIDIDIFGKHFGVRTLR